MTTSARVAWRCNQWTPGGGRVMLVTVCPGCVPARPGGRCLCPLHCDPDSGCDDHGTCHSKYQTGLWSLNLHDDDDDDDDDDGDDDDYHHRYGDDDDGHDGEPSWRFTPRGCNCVDVSV